jgi:pimeloyl-ACP methyl ester carboxylesterase
VIILLYLVCSVLLAIAVYLGVNIYVTRRWAAKAEELIPPTGNLIEIDGNQIRYVDEGQGRPIVFVHGLGGQLHHFKGPLFDHLKNEFRLIALDRPGSGYSVRKAGSTGRLREQAAVVAGLIERLGVEKPLVVGHSLGGMISLTLALEHPGKVGALALLSPLTTRVTNPPEGFAGLAIASPLVRWFLANTLAIPMSAKAAPQTLDFVFGPQAPTADYGVAGGGWLGLRPAHFYATSTDYVAVNDEIDALAARVGEIKIPVGVLFGDKDRVLDFEEQGQSMSSRIDGVEVEIVEGIGHMPQFVATQATLAFIRRMARRAFGG